MNKLKHTELEEAIKYRVEQEYEKYHNDLTFEHNGKDFWIEQITNKLANSLETFITAQKEQLIKQLEEAVMGAVGEDDRDYSKDNADEVSLKILVACSVACNQLRQELRSHTITAISKIRGIDE